MKAYFLTGNNEASVRLDFHFRAGAANDENPAMAGAANTLFSESTRSMSSELLAERLDRKGVFLDRDCGKDFSRFTVFCLKHNLNEVLEIIKEVFEEPGFNESDLEIYINQRIQKLRVNQERNSWLAGKSFLNHLFSDNHPYGSTSDVSDITQLTQSTVKRFYESHYGAENAYLIASGAVSEEGATRFEMVPFIKNTVDCATSNGHSLSKTVKTGVFKMEGPNKQQVALKMGGRTIGRNHPDLPGLSLLYTLLGGYFGSRLMKNIREEKGLTYGISAGVVHLKDASYWTIQSDIKQGAEELVLAEIQKEISLLKSMPVGDAELATVKNYLSGVYSRMFDGVFSKSERLSVILNSDLSTDYYSTLVQTMKRLGSDEIMGLANKYFNEQETITVLVG